MRRIGHKGADLIRPGNTIESFEAAVEAGAEMIELDVLRPRAEFRDGADWRRAAAGPVADGAPPCSSRTTGATPAAATRCVSTRRWTPSRGRRLTASRSTAT